MFNVPSSRRARDARCAKTYQQQYESVEGMQCKYVSAAAREVGCGEMICFVAGSSRLYVRKVHVTLSFAKRQARLRDAHVGQH